MKINKVKKENKPMISEKGDILIKFKFNKSMLNLFIGYSLCESSSISKMNLSNLDKLMEITDPRTYEADIDLYTRFRLIKDVLNAKLRKGLTKKDAILSSCMKENDVECQNLIKNIDDFTDLKQTEIKYITNAVIDRLQYSFLVIYKEIIINEFMRIDTGEYESFKDVVESVKDKCGALMNEIRKADVVNSNITFSLKEDVFDSLVTDTVVKASNPTTALVTGIQLLNDVLSPGYIQGRLYIWLG